MPAKRTARGNLFTRGKQGRWYCQHYIDGRQIVTRLLNEAGLPCANKKEAETARDLLMAPLAMKDKAAQLRTAVANLTAVEDQAAALVESARSKLAIAAAWQEFEESPNRPQSGPITLKDYAGRWSKFVVWAAGQGLVSMEAVGPGHAATFVKSLAGSSPNRYNKIVQTCGLVFRVLADQCANMPDPFANITRRRLATQSRRELNIDHLRLVCQAAVGELRTLLAVGLYTGLRLHDAVELNWRDVDMARGVLTVRPFKTASRTGKSLVIPMFPALRAILEETPPARRLGDVMPDLAARYRKDPPAVSKLVSGHFRQCGLAVHQEGTGKGTGRRAVVAYSYHSLRHSFVSLAAAANVPLAVVQELAGHGSPAIQRHYLHLGEDATRAGIAALPDVLEVPMVENSNQEKDKANRARLAKLIKAATPDQVGRMLAILEGGK